MTAKVLSNGAHQCDPAEPCPGWAHAPPDNNLIADRQTRRAALAAADRPDRPPRTPTRPPSIAGRTVDLFLAKIEELAARGYRLTDSQIARLNRLAGEAPHPDHPQRP